VCEDHVCVLYHLLELLSLKHFQVSVIIVIRANEYSLAGGITRNFLNNFLHYSLFWAPAMILFCRSYILLLPDKLPLNMLLYEGVSKSFWTELITKCTITTINTYWEVTQRVMVAKFTRLTHKIVIQLHLVTESHTICSSHSRQPFQKLLVTPSYVMI